MPAPDGPQWVTVYHASTSHEEPHRMLEDWEPGLEKYSNAHYNVLHMGTEESMKHPFLANKRFMHKYSIPDSHIYPVTFGDEGHLMRRQAREDRAGGATPFSRAMKGVQPGLFETVSGDPELALSSGMAVPYRNMAEGVGEISYMMPKSLIHSGVGKYHGITLLPHQVWGQK